MPKSGALLGAYAFPGTPTAARSLEKLIGRGLSISAAYYGWTTQFPGTAMREDAVEGRIPLVSWSATIWTGGHVELRDVASGKWDDLIRKRASEARAWGAPFFLRPFWEMNGRWMTYNGNPALYIAAWRHIHDIFAAAGATNAVWVWSPDAVDVPATTSNHWSAYYPGDGYVDWVGVDGYNWSSTEAPRTFSQIFQPFYRDYAGRKPVMVAETASCEERVDKAAWIRGAAAQIRASFPEIKALIWFNADKECDWRINSSAAALRAFVTSFASEPYFAGRAGAPRRDTPSLTGPA